MQQDRRGVEHPLVNLGYHRYGAQGGGCGGGAVTTQIGRNRGRCVAIHTTMPVSYLPRTVRINRPTKSGGH